MAAAFAAKAYRQVAVGASEARVEEVLGTQHHDSPVVWDPAADRCWVYSFAYLAEPFTFCFDGTGRLMMKAKGIS